MRIADADADCGLRIACQYQKGVAEFLLELSL